MCLTEFVYNGNKTIIQCNPDEQMKNICEKFAEKVSIDINSIYFLYSSRKVNYDLTYYQTANNEDKIRNQINVLVYSNDNNKDPDKLISKDIICPKCKETSKLKINDYKVCLYDCKHKHKTNDISLDEYENSQDISNVICDECKNITISKAFNNTFYKCYNCDINLCPLCKAKHDKLHLIINYEQKSYLCNLHKELYNSYCQSCEKNLCALCQNEHNGHEIISFRNIKPNINDIEIRMKELRETIDNFEKNIQEIIDILNKVIKGIEKYYNINNYIFINYKNSRTYESLCNIINLLNINKDDYAMRDMNEIINDRDICNKFNSIFKIYKKIDFNSDNQDEIKIIYKINKNENENSVRIFGSNFVDNNKDICKIIYNGNEYELQNEFNLKNIDINREDNLEIKLKGVKNIKDMSSMFCLCKSLLSVPDISKLDTSKVKNMSGMFDVCSSLKSLPDISNWDTSKVENMSGIFHKCSSLSSLPDISKWNTSKVKSMDYMFSGCKLLASLPDISKWNISNVTDKDNMFDSCNFPIPDKFTQ